jgi:hypothetical protein
LRTARYTFPSPELEPEVPDKIWGMIGELVKKIGDPYTSLERVGSVIEGFYNDMPHLIYNPKKVPKDIDPQVNIFADKYLKYNEKKGREFVIYSEYNLLDLLKSYGKF